ncbi:MAG TPA: nuclear transport factor 2 family protein [Candidatus Acidoferrum sp.]|nr:nuclear transport factor 2 family protein [Candidatus Acidoferrum sp.]
MDNAARLTEFFEYENSRQWEKYAGCLAEDVVWTLNGSEVMDGRTAYMRRITAAYEGSDDTFVCRRMTGEGERIATELVNTRGVTSICVFDFAQGLIFREWEFILD